MELEHKRKLVEELQNESVRTQPTTAMDGNVTRPMLIADLLKSMKDVNFSQLVTEYGSMAGINDKSITPNINALMAERERVPETPLKQAQTPTPPPTQPTAPPPVVDEIAEPINVPTPMADAMSNVTMSPTGTVTEQNTGLMSNTTQQIA